MRRGRRVTFAYTAKPPDLCVKRYFSKGIEMSEAKLREEICAIGASIFARGLTTGSSGNISVKTEEGWLMTPTGSSLGRLDPARLSKLGHDGRLVSGDPPTKESFLHRVMYEERAATGAVVHLHSTHSVAVSCLAEIDPADVLPPITAYYVMRVGRMPLVPYFRPGDLQLAEAVRGFAGKHHAVLLANHGPVVAGSDLDAAVNAIEELEETAKLYLLLRSAETRYLTGLQVMELQG
jgi:ribulose-5-phosphate 4-epimerase/fuculose-1-phosphate aldolase